MLQGCIPCSSMADLQLRSLAAELTSAGKEMHRAPTDDPLRHGPRKLEITGMILGHCHWSMNTAACNGHQHCCRASHDVEHHELSN